MAAAYPLAPVRYKATDSNGQPLIGGKVYAYVAGSTTTPKDTYSDKNMGNLNTWPVVLDDAGSAAIYISGDYYFRIFDAGGVLVEEGDGIADPKSVAQAIFAAGSGTGNLESRVADLETSRNEHTVRLNTLADTTAGLQTQITAEVNTNRNAAITAAINSLRTDLEGKINTLSTEFQGKLDAQRIRVGDCIETTSSVNPGQPVVSGGLGYGTWELDGRGQVVVGYSDNIGDPAWTKTVGNIGGDYTKTLNGSEMPNQSFTYQKFTGQLTGEVSTVPIDGNGAVRYADNQTVTIGNATPTPISLVQPYIIRYRYRRTA